MLKNALTLGTFALLGTLTLAACDPDGDGDTDILPDPIESSCSNYCEQRNVCDDEVNVDSCTADCVENANNCQADEQEQALDELDVCAEESCDDIAACTIGAGLECYFGI
ncbi:MAG: hypothetical protein R3F59_23885 [Myxococcota bacterium]